MIKQHAVNATEAINEINDKLKTFYDILENSKNDDAYIRSIIMSFSPFEWEQIAVTIAHYQRFKRKLKTLKEDKDILNYLRENACFIGYMIDIVNMYYARLPKGNQA